MKDPKIHPLPSDGPSTRRMALGMLAGFGTLFLMAWYWDQIAFSGLLERNAGLYYRLNVLSFEHVEAGILKDPLLLPFLAVESFFLLGSAVWATSTIAFPSRSPVRIFAVLAVGWGLKQIWSCRPIWTEFPAYPVAHSLQLLFSLAAVASGFWLAAQTRRLLTALRRRSG